MSYRPGTNYALRLAHRLQMTDPKRWQASSAELRGLAREAFAQSEDLKIELHRLRRIIANMGPKFQGMTELA